MRQALKVAETFVSLQGEGLMAGLPCFFIRLAGCNLRCAYCDTAYAQEGGRDVESGELVGEWMRSGVRLVQVTGGEPLLQSGCLALMSALVRRGARVVLETNGSYPVAAVPREVVKVVDVKTPGSGHVDAWYPANLRWINAGDQLKFVITSPEDYQWAKDYVLGAGLSHFTNVLFSPAWGLMDPAELASLILGDRLPVRLQVQLHKVLWGDKKGT